MPSDMGTGGAYLVIDGPGHAGTEQPLREGITSFGRLPSNDVVLLGDLVSRHHARILFFDGRASLQDLGSHNGAWLNGERVTTRPIADGDSIRLGNFKINFHASGSQADAAMPEPERESDTEQNPVVPARVTTVAPTVPPASNRTPEVALPESVETRDPSQSVLIQQLGQVAAAGGRDNDALFLMFRVTDALARAKDVHDFVEEALELVLERIGAGVGAFYRQVPGDRAPELVCAGGPDLAEDAVPSVPSTVLRWAIAKNFTVYSKDVSTDVRFDHGASVAEMPAEGRSLVCAPVGSKGEVLGALYVSRPASNPIEEAEVDAIEAVAHLCGAGIEQLDTRQLEIQVGMVREALSRFHAPDVVDRILEEARAGRPRSVLEGRTATVAFCDIQGFTDLADRLPAEDVSSFLNDYLERMSGIVFAHHGTLTKQLGDGLVAVFGAPYAHGNDACNAVAAALEMRRDFDQLMSTLPSVGPRRLRVGINTGWTLSGATGSPSRMDYTIIGETVNIAARIQASAAPGAVVIGAETEPLVREQFLTEEIGLQKIQGRRDPIMLFQVAGTL